MNHIETLESRTLLAADPGNTLATAQDLGSLSGTQTLTESLSRSDGDDYYKLALASRTNFNLRLTGLTANADVQLLNGKGAIVATSDRSDAANEKLSLSLGRGTYYVRIFTPAPAKTTYTVSFTADLNWGSVKLNGERRSVGLVFADGSTRAIADKTTWIVIHGWQGSPQDGAIPQLSAAVDAQSSKDQVLVLDWSSPASTDVFTAAAWAHQVAQFLSNTLQRWGIPPLNINMAGHSFGAFIADLGAAELGGVNRLIALDPATDLITTVDLAADSRFSVAFIGSSFGNASVAATADETFKLKVGTFDSEQAHTNVADLFASMFAADGSANPDAISRLFAPSQLSPSVPMPWRSNAYAGGYEGTLTGRESDGHWVPAKLVYKDRITGQVVTVTV